MRKAFYNLKIYNGNPKILLNYGYAPASVDINSLKYCILSKEELKNIISFLIERDVKFEI